MSFHVGPVQGASVSHLPPPRSGRSTRRRTARFAQGLRPGEGPSRARRTCPWPCGTRVDKAAQIAADLEAAGRSVRFTASDEGGRVRAELCGRERQR